MLDAWNHVTRHWYFNERQNQYHSFCRGKYAPKYNSHFDERFILSLPWFVFVMEWGNAPGIVLEAWSCDKPITNFRCQIIPTIRGSIPSERERKRESEGGRKRGRRVTNGTNGIAWIFCCTRAHTQQWSREATYWHVARFWSAVWVDGNWWNGAAGGRRRRNSGRWRECRDHRISNYPRSHFRMITLVSLTRVTRACSRHSFNLWVNKFFFLDFPFEF